MKGRLAGRGFIETHGSCKIPGYGRMNSVSYPHPLHSRHGPERPEGPQGSHCPEGLDSSSSKQGGSEVDQRDLRLMLGLLDSYHVCLLVSYLIVDVSVMVLVKHVSGGSGRRVNS